ncbi:MAG: M13 family metallopeptidase [Alphaproteobacteria bacterium]|uniref:M13 family metallopeptidase n=1 Tax=Maricaulis alexandrii TaxID=2570354 RepID=UPI001107B0F9|nr:M13 family metallopeptidase [Maricaulis alexandrii]MCR9267090.1 M13 family metallopeptidase [Alphaproteobacteria bacterium]
MKKLLLSSVALAIVAACSPTGTTDGEAENAAVEMAGTPELGAWGFDLAGMNTEIAPGDDFNQYANGTWLETEEMPSDLSRYGMFTVLHLEAEEQVKEIITDLGAVDAADGTVEQQVGDLYGSWMDTETIEQRGLAPAQPFLDEIAAAESHADISALFATIHHQSPFGVGIIPDPADTTRYTVFVGQDGLGLPDRDYYLEEDNQRYRDAYHAYIEEIFDLAGIEGGAEKADAIIALETAIAQVHWTQADSRDIQKIYNPMPLDQLAALAPQFDFVSGMEQLGLDGVATYLVAQPSAIEGAGIIFAETPVEVWQDYMTFHFLSNNAARLPEAFDTASFNMFGRTMRGTEEQRPRDRRGANLVGGQLGEAVGQVYVERHFPPSSKAAMEGLVENLIVAFRGRLENLAWMDDETRAEALSKLSTFEPRIGYPDEWRDYSALEIRADDLFGNMVRLREFNWNDQVEDLTGPVDRGEWPYPPQTVNASYNPLMNQITFPAGILQPPFFDPYADPAVNYGGIGAVIGHEIGHGFDDQGRRFDENGAIRDWWTPETNAAFEERAERLELQYNSYSPVEGRFVNGDLTMGENIGDLGGLQMAYTAYRQYLDNCCGGEAPVIDGLTGDQRFFLAWAQVWRGLIREDQLINQLATDPHSPAQYRINGVVRNLDAWYEAFGVTEENDLYLPPEERVSIW